tara:strand:+ start:501 stop:698 length:198 start_codon:yes stop_codon:yes gene_type:complete
MYVASIEVIESWYKGETNRTTEVHIVEAITQEQAVAKLEHHYSLQDSEYCVTYTIEVTSINELIR